MSGKFKIKPKRIAVIDIDKCKPNKCNRECKSSCPVERTGIDCVSIESLVEDIVVQKKKTKVAIVESACIGCGICVKACPFDAIRIVNVPSEIGNFVVHRYGENGFRLYKMPNVKPYQILGLLGQNGIGKSTIMNLLSGKLKPNFEEFDKKFTDQEIINHFKGTEIHKYMDRLYKGELTVTIKTQHVDKLSDYLKSKDLDPDVGTYLCEKSDYKNNDKFFLAVIEVLELTDLFKSKVRTLSGGELQRVVCAQTILKKTDVHIFDEPTNFLDVRQRLNLARLIRSMAAPDHYIIVIEHDLTILDYLSDYICLMYGTPGAYGAVSLPYSTADAINIYFDGYIPAENMRFRQSEYNIKSIDELDQPMDFGGDIKKSQYDAHIIEYPSFQLTINKGSFSLESSLTILLGENGVGKTSFINYLAKHLQTSISHKPQHLNIDQFKKSNGRFQTVLQVYFTKIPESYGNDLFRSDVVRPLNIEAIKNKAINELSGGELQRFWIVLCLGTPAQIYLIDEPSACLDVEQRVLITKIIRKFMVHNRKVAFIVEHDMMMAVSLVADIDSQVIVVEKGNKNQSEIRSCVAHPPQTFQEGINRFLKSLDITFRTDSSGNGKGNGRPRINKLNSVKDKLQKKQNKYYS